MQLQGDSVLKDHQYLRNEYKKLKLHDHLGLVYNSPDEWLHYAIPFIVEGLVMDEPCLCIVDGNTSETLRVHLSRSGIDIDATLRGNKLCLIDEAEFFLSETDVPIRNVLALLNETANGMRSGASAARLVVDCSNMAQDHWSAQQLLEFSLGLKNEFYPQHNYIGFHQYDRNKIDPETSRILVSTHPFLLRNNRVYNNLYYLALGDHSHEKRHELESEIEHWLSAIESSRSNQERTRLLAYALEYSSQPFLAGHANGHIVMWNRAFTDLTGYDREDLLKMTWDTDITPGDWHQLTSEMVKQLLDSGEPVRYQKEYQRKDGSRVDVEVLLHLIDDEEGKPRYVYAFITDISERKRTEQALKKSEEEYRTIFETTGTAMMILEEDSMISLANSETERLTGFQKEEVIGKISVLDFIKEDMREMVIINHQKRRVDSDSVPNNYELQIVRKDGELRDISITVAMIPGSKRSVIALQDITERKQAEEALKISESRFSKAFHASPDIWAILEYETRRFIDVNQSFTLIMGFEPHEVLGRTLCEMGIWVDPQKRKLVLDRLDFEKPIRDLEAPFRTKSGETRIGLTSVEIIDFGGQKCALFVIHDITDYKKAQEEVRLSEERYRTIFETTGSPTVIFDQEGTIILVNNQFEKRTGLNKEHVEGKMKWLNFVAPEDQERMLEYDRLRFEDSSHAPRDYEAKLMTGLDGEIRDAMMSVATIPGTSLGVVSMLDITERRRSEEQLRYLSLHDSLTGLYNRTYFEEEMRRLDAGRYDPVSLVIFDVDGLKLVNDTLGHKAGDEMLVAAALVLKSCFRDSDVVARVGGDEFAALLSRTAEEMVYKATERVRKAIESYNLTGPPVPLSISLGYAVRLDSSMDLEQLYKDADNNMYKTKSHNSRLARTAIVKSLMDSLNARGLYITRHEQQMEDMAVRMAQEVGLPNKNVEEIKLLSKYHDIGLVGISDSIIIKPDLLDDKEMSEAHRHCEIGHRIAQSTPDLAVIADWILKHHEWWNGEGYPLGLKGLEIPVESRIIAICDAYDAMTSERPYRLTVSSEEALTELHRCAGTQFDPALVPIFIKVVKEIRAVK